jgi:hypothetical protein
MSIAFNLVLCHTISPITVTGVMGTGQLIKYMVKES